MILHGRLSLSGIRAGQIALTIAHDQQTDNPCIVTAPLKFCQISSVFGFILKEPVHVLNGIDAELISGQCRKIQMIKFTGLYCTVQRPLGQGDFEEQGIRSFRHDVFI